MQVARKFLAPVVLMVAIGAVPYSLHRYNERIVQRVAPRDSAAAQIVAAAKTQIGNGYDADYRVIAYPGGDVPAGRGACSDVVIRALRSVKIDLQQRVHEDMTASRTTYPHARNAALDVDRSSASRQSGLLFQPARPDADKRGVTGDARRVAAGRHRLLESLRQPGSSRNRLGCEGRRRNALCNPQCGPVRGRELPYAVAYCRPLSDRGADFLCTESTAELACRGILLRQSGHSRVVAASGVSVFLWDISQLDRLHDQKKDHECKNNEADNCIQEVPNQKFASVDAIRDIAKADFAWNTNQRIDNILGERRDYAAECRPDDNANRQVHHVSPQDKRLKFAAETHVLPFIPYLFHVATKRFTKLLRLTCERPIFVSSTRNGWGNLRMLQDAGGPPTAADCVERIIIEGIQVRKPRQDAPRRRSLAYRGNGYGVHRLIRETRPKTCAQITGGSEKRLVSPLR